VAHAEPIAPQRRVPFWRRLGFEETVAGYVFLVPWLVGLLVLTLYPMGFSLVMGLFRWDIINKPVYIGLDNYRTILHDRLFWISLRQTFIYSVIRVPLMLGFGLFLAVLLNQRIRAQGFFRTAFYLPAVIPDVAMIVMWIWLLSEGRTGLARPAGPCRRSS
jgi:multiple sugar transport system permease protein